MNANPFMTNEEYERILNTKGAMYAAWESVEKIHSAWQAEHPDDERSLIEITSSREFVSWYSDKAKEYQ